MITDQRPLAGMGRQGVSRMITAGYAPTSQRSELSARVAELLRPAAFAHPAPHPRLIETHISWVILAGAFVYKIRKPVDFGFLDFSTLESEGRQVTRTTVPTIQPAMINQRKRTVNRPRAANKR